MAKLISDIFKGNIFKGDKVVWMIWFLLCMVSLVEVYSASSRMTFTSTNHLGPMLSQASFLVFGLLVILAVHRIPCKWFMLFPFVLLPVTFCLLAITTLGGGGGELNGTNRWMNIAGISFQPSEFAKCALIMSAAVILSKTQTEQKKIVHGKEKWVVGATKGKKPYMPFLILSILTVLICGLIFADNISTSAMLFVVIVLMMFFAHVPVGYMLRGGLCIGAFLLIVGSLAVALPDTTLQEIPLMNRVVTVKHRMMRKMGLAEDEELKMKRQADYDNFIAHLDEKCKPGTVDYNNAIADYNKKQEIADLLGDKNSQSTYANIAIANSNVIGLGPGNSIQRDFLQHAESDFIYAIIIEEMGLVGALVVMSLYIILLIRCGRIAQRCKTFFPAYLVLGLGIMMVLQALVNMAVAVGAIPVTGQTLPLISKGGSSVLVTSGYIGMILSVSRYATVQKPSKVPDESNSEGETLEYTTDGTMV